jgi:MFS family permease
LKLSVKNRAYKQLIATQMLGESVVIYPLYSIMFGERSDISAAGVGILLAAWQITQILAEVPTGLIADRFSKKYSIVAGKIGKMLCFAIWFFQPNFYGYLAGFIMWGIGEAFVSGAVQAYLYELDSDDSSHFLKKYSRMKSLMMFSYTVTYFITFLIGPRYQLLIGISVLTMFVAFLLSLMLPASKITHSLKSRQILSIAENTLTSSRILMLKFIRGLSIAGAIGMLIELIVVNYRDYGMSPKVVPLVISLSTLVSAASFWLLHRYESFVRRHYILCTVVFVGIFLALFPFGLWLKAFGLFLVARYMRVLAVMLESDLQYGLPGSSRATIISTYSLAEKLLTALFIFIIGVSAVNNSIAVPTLVVITASCILFIFIELLNPSNLNTKNNKLTNRREVTSQ